MAQHAHVAGLAGKNVMGLLPGRDPVLRNEAVIVGAHYDHIGMGPAIDHDSVRAFNMVARKRGADDPNPRSVTAEQMARIAVLRDSLRAVELIRETTAS